MTKYTNSNALNRELSEMQVSHTKEGKRIEKGTVYFIGYILAIGTVIATLYSLGLIID
jgi:hypothetical protein